MTYLVVLQFIIPYVGTRGEEGGGKRGGEELLAKAGAVALVAMIIGIISMWYEVLSKVAIISLCLIYHTC